MVKLSANRALPQRVKIGHLTSSLMWYMVPVLSYTGASKALKMNSRQWQVNPPTMSWGKKGASNSASGPNTRAQRASTWEERARSHPKQEEGCVARAEAMDMVMSLWQLAARRGSNMANTTAGNRETACADRDQEAEVAQEKVSAWLETM